MPGLDAYTTGLVGLYSTRRALWNSAALVRARRVSDGAVVKVYPDANGKLSLTSPTVTPKSTVTLGDWAAGGTVTAEWEDMSPAARHLLQSDPLKQPTIVQDGVLMTEGSQPALKFDGAGDVLKWASSATLGQCTIVARFAADGSDSNNDHVVSFWGTPGFVLRPKHSDNANSGDMKDYPVTARGNVTTISIIVGASSREFRHNGTTYHTSAFGSLPSSTLHVGDFQAGGYASAGRLLEIAIWDHTKSTADVAAIEADQMAFAAAPAPVSTFREFETDPTGQFPSGLTAVGPNTAGMTTVVTKSSRGRARTLQSRSTSTEANNKFFGFALPTLSGDADEVLALVNHEDPEYSNGEFGGVALNMDAAGGHAYHLRFAKRGGVFNRVAIVKYDGSYDKAAGDGAGAIAAITYTWVKQKWYYLRLRREGATLYGKVWAADEAEPTAWSMQGIDAAPLSGGAPGVGIGQHSNRHAWFGFVSHASGGGTAPLGPTLPDTATYYQETAGQVVIDATRPHEIRTSTGGNVNWAEETASSGYNASQMRATVREGAGTADTALDESALVYKVWIKKPGAYQLDTVSYGLTGGDSDSYWPAMDGILFPLDQSSSGHPAGSSLTSWYRHASSRVWLEAGAHTLEIHVRETDFVAQYLALTWMGDAGTPSAPSLTTISVAAPTTATPSPTHEVVDLTFRDTYTDTNDPTTPKGAADLLVYKHSEAENSTYRMPLWAVDVPAGWDTNAEAAYFVSRHANANASWAGGIHYVGAFDAATVTYNTRPTVGAQWINTTTHRIVHTASIGQAVPWPAKKSDINTAAVGGVLYVGGQSGVDFGKIHSAEHATPSRWVYIREVQLSKNATSARTLPAFQRSSTATHAPPLSSSHEATSARTLPSLQRSSTALRSTPTTLAEHPTLSDVQFSYDFEGNDPERDVSPTTVQLWNAPARVSGGVAGTLYGTSSPGAGNPKWEFVGGGFAPAGVFTLSFWVKASNWISSPDLFAGTTAGSPWSLYTNGHNFVSFQAGTASGTNDYSSDTTYWAGADEWVHVLVWTDATTAYLRIRHGQGTFTASVATTDPIERLFLGTSSSSSDYAVDGGIDRVQLWHRTLTESERDDLYNGARGREYGTAPAPSSKTWVRSGGVWVQAAPKARVGGLWVAQKRRVGGVWI
jgi:hypothetical protein